MFVVPVQLNTVYAIELTNVTYNICVKPRKIFIYACIGAHINGIAENRGYFRGAPATTVRGAKSFFDQIVHNATQAYPAN